MLDHATRTAILELKSRGCGVRQIARTLRISRGAVRKVLALGTPQVPEIERPCKADAYKDDILEQYAALDQDGEGTKEFVDADSSGRVRAIQRYYDSVTGPFAAGVAASLVPVACLRVSFELPPGSLSRLRRVLASEGCPAGTCLSRRVR